MFGFGGSELLILCGVIVLLFGSSQIPKLARSLGRAKSELQRGLNEGIQEAKAETDAQG